MDSHDLFNGIQPKLILYVADKNLCKIWIVMKNIGF